MSYIEDKLAQKRKEYLGINGYTTEDAVKFNAQLWDERIEPILRTSLEEYRRELMSCIPEEKRNNWISEAIAFNKCRQQILNNIKEKEL